MFRKSATYVLLLLISLNSMAALEAPMKFNGQNAETVKLEKIIKVIRPVPREVPGTCTRKIPYQVNRCHDVTRYRQECSWVPADQDCQTEYDRQCRSVTRYRDECTRGPSRQECHTTPTRQVCHDRPTRQVCTELPPREECTTTPSREVCVDRPTREVCRTLPNGGNHCTTVGGGQHCTTVGGDRQCRQVGGGQHCTQVGGGQDCQTVGGDNVCRTVEGDPICRQVSYQDQECENVPRQSCRTIPAHNECNQIPYSEEVCGPETEYREEQYACMQTVHDDKEIEKKVSAVMNVSIKTNGLVEEFGALVTLTPDEKGDNFIPSMKLTTEPKILVIVKGKEARIRAEGEKEIRVEGEIELELQEAVSGSVVFPEVESATFTKKTNLLSVIFAKALPSDMGVARNGELDFEMTFKGKQVAALKDAFPGKKVQVKKVDNGDSLILNLAGLVQGSMRGGLFSSAKPLMKLQLKIPSKIEGDILNAKKPQAEKLYESVKVKKL